MAADDRPLLPSKIAHLVDARIYHPIWIAQQGQFPVKGLVHEVSLAQDEPTGVGDVGRRLDPSRSFSR